MTSEDTDLPAACAGSQSLEFNDHFSGHAAEYAWNRPTYPKALFDFLAARAPGREQAWDCATGSGQSALALAAHFERVVATDASKEQLAAAAQHARVEYRLECAESTSLLDASCDLVAVAQAVHWFDSDRFYAEVRRVARSRALVAVWTYDVMRVDSGIDGLLDVFHQETVAKYWPVERKLVDAHYATLAFPFDELATPDFEMAREWTVDRALGYLDTSSAVRRFAADRRENPLKLLEPALRSAWGRDARLVRWPLTVRVGRIE